MCVGLLKMYLPRVPDALAMPQPSVDTSWVFLIEPDHSCPSWPKASFNHTGPFEDSLPIFAHPFAHFVCDCALPSLLLLLTFVSEKKSILETRVHLSAASWGPK